MNSFVCFLRLKLYFCSFISLSLFFFNPVWLKWARERIYATGTSCDRVHTNTEHNTRLPNQRHQCAWGPQEPWLWFLFPPFPSDISEKRKYLIVFLCLFVCLVEPGKSRALFLNSQRKVKDLLLCPTVAPASLLSQDKKHTKTRKKARERDNTWVACTIKQKALLLFYPNNEDWDDIKSDFRRHSVWIITATITSAWPRPSQSKCDLQTELFWSQ